MRVPPALADVSRLQTKAGDNAMSESCVTARVYAATKCTRVAYTVGCPRGEGVSNQSALLLGVGNAPLMRGPAERERSTAPELH